MKPDANNSLAQDLRTLEALAHGAHISASPPNFNLCFNGVGGKEIARLYEDEDGRLNFRGELTRAARLFLQYTVDIHNRRVDLERHKLHLANEEQARLRKLAWDAVNGCPNATAEIREYLAHDTEEATS